MQSSKNYFNQSPKLLVQQEPGFINDITLTDNAKSVMSILDLLESGEAMEFSELIERTGYRPEVMTDALIELFDSGYLLIDQTRKKLAH